MTATARTQAGWTLWETMVAVSLLALVLLVFTELFVTSESLVRDTRAKHRAEETLRRNLEALSNVVRDVALSSVDGFDDDGVATNPTFSRVTGADTTGQIYSALEELQWRPSGVPVRGVTSPGQVLHVRGGVAVLVADRVPDGGFSVWVDGKTLVLEVRTYYVVRDHLEVVAGSTAVALRN